MKALSSLFLVLATALRAAATDQSVLWIPSHCDGQLQGSLQNGNFKVATPNMGLTTCRNSKATEVLDAASIATTLVPGPAGANIDETSTTTHGPQTTVAGSQSPTTESQGVQRKHVQLRYRAPGREALARNSEPQGGHPAAIVKHCFHDLGFFVDPGEVPKAINKFCTTVVDQDKTIVWGGDALGKIWSSSLNFYEVESKKFGFALRIDSLQKQIGQPTVGHDNVKVAEFVKNCTSIFTVAWSCINGGKGGIVESMGRLWTLQSYFMGC